MINITFEKRRSIKDIQNAFKSHLSQKEILKSTAGALNETSKNTLGFIKKSIPGLYTVKTKYLKNFGSLTYAKGSHSKLYTETRFSYRPTPLSSFRYSGIIGKKTGIGFEVKRGNPQLFRHAFLMKSKTGTIGIYSPGKYANGKFVSDTTPSGKKMLTQIKTASPYTMSLAKNMQPKIIQYVDKTLPSRLKYYLQKKVDKMRNI